MLFHVAIKGLTGNFLISNLLFGVTGSVGILSVPEYIWLLKGSVAKNVYVMMIYSAKKFVTPYTLRLFSQNYVFTDSFNISDDVRIPHIELTRKCDMFLIMPATANIIGKAANGICDDLISTAIMACQAPIIFVPAMNPSIWFSTPNQKNVLALKEMGYHVLQPSEGYEMADMKPSFGSIPPFEVIREFLIKIMASKC
jgi:phosphopantothenoylcysteine synthetase/decarboxylase